MNYNATEHDAARASVAAARFEVQKMYHWLGEVSEYLPACPQDCCTAPVEVRAARIVEAREALAAATVTLSIAQAVEVAFRKDAA